MEFNLGGHTTKKPQQRQNWSQSQLFLQNFVLIIVKNLVISNATNTSCGRLGADDKNHGKIIVMAPKNSA